MKRLRDLKKRLMEDPKFREEYARADQEYALVARAIRARMAESSHNQRFPKRLGTTQSVGLLLKGRS